MRNGTPATPNGKNERGQPVLRERIPCTRCGGQGGSKAWEYTGWTCYRCEGKCWDPNPLVSILYTAEQNAKLDAAWAKRHETQQRKAAIRAEIEQHRRDRERGEMVSAWQPLLDRIAAELVHGSHEIMESVVDRITVQAKEPSERQIEVVEQVMARRAADR